MELAFEGSAGLQSRSTALLSGPFGLGGASKAGNTTAGSKQVILIETFVHEESYQGAIKNIFPLEGIKSSTVR